MRRAPAVCLPVILVVCAAGIVRADVIHLKNGATIQADAWEARGDDLLVRQGQGRLVIPRSDVVRIDAAGPPAGSTSALPALAPPAPATPPAPAGPTPTRDQLLQAVETLKRRLREVPLARDANARQLVGVLNHLGTLAYKARDFDQAMTRFREALAYEPHNASAEFGLAASYLSTGQDLYARSVLEQALLAHPEDPDLHALLGDVYYGEERPEEALASWERSFSLRPAEGVGARIAKLRRERAVDSGYVRSEAVHFTLKYDGDSGGPDLSSQIVDYLESQFRDLQGRFDHYPVQPIVVVLYPQRQFYEATLAESNVAGLFDGKIRVPIGGLRQIDNEARRVLLHELTHAFIHGKSHGAAPRWLHEGIAQYVEGRRTPSGTATALAKDFRDLPDRASWGGLFSYPTSLSFVEYLVDREGFNRLVDVLDGLGRGASLEEAFQAATRESLPDLRRAWGESLVSVNLH